MISTFEEFISLKGHSSQLYIIAPILSIKT
jgi:hypothetical protein